MFLELEPRLLPWPSASSIGTLAQAPHLAPTLSPDRTGGKSGGMDIDVISEGPAHHVARKGLVDRGAAFAPPVRAGRRQVHHRRAGGTGCSAADVGDGGRADV